jgi:dihydroflavonol-4-reductase
LKALVTGSAGFIGSAVVRELLADGWEVRALYLPLESTKNLDGLDVERFAGDVTDPAAMRAATRGCDLVFHLAALYTLWTPEPSRLWHVNVQGTRTVLEAAARAGVRRVVHCSSIARFGGQGLHRRADEGSPFALGETGDLYARSKSDGHEVAVGAAHAGQDVVIVAPTGPIGPGDIGPTPTGRLLLSGLNLPATLLVPSISNFAHVNDIARGHLLAARHGRRGETYLLGSEDVPLAELARRVHALAGVSRPILQVPYAVAEAAAHAALAYSERVSGKPPLFTPAAVRIARLGLAARCDKAVRELGLAPRPLEAALRDALVWWASPGHGDRYIHDAALRARILARHAYHLAGDGPPDGPPGPSGDADVAPITPSVSSA